MDPASIYFGISEIEDGKINYAKDFHFKGKDIKERYLQIALQLALFLKEAQIPDYYGIETTWFAPYAKNAASAIKISIVRGIVIGAIFSNNHEAKIIDVTPIEARSTFSLGRGAQKEDVHRAMQREHTYFDFTKTTEDSRDACAIGLTAYYKAKQCQITQTQFLSKPSCR